MELNEYTNNVHENQMNEAYAEKKRRRRKAAIESIMQEASVLGSFVCYAALLAVCAFLIARGIIF